MQLPPAILALVAPTFSLDALDALMLDVVDLFTITALLLLFRLQRSLPLHRTELLEESLLPSLKSQASWLPFMSGILLL